MDFLRFIASSTRRQSIVSELITDHFQVPPFAQGDLIDGNIVVVYETGDPTAPVAAFVFDSCTAVALTNGKDVVYASANGLSVTGNTISFDLQVSSTELDTAMAATTEDWLEAFLEVRIAENGQDGLLIREPVTIERAATLAPTPTPPPAEIADTFARADGPLGANWTKQLSASGATFVVMGYRAQPDASGQHTFAFWSASTFTDDQYAEVQIPVVGPWTGVILRADNTLDRFYIGMSFAPNDYRIFSRWDETFNSLATGTDVTWIPGDRMKLEIEGSAHPITITMYRNDVEVLSWTSLDASQVRAGGSPGIGVYSPLVGGLPQFDAGLSLYNWRGGNL